MSKDGLIKNYIIIGIIFLLIIQPSNNRISGESNIVWSENFNDGDLNGWRVEGEYTPLIGEWQKTNGLVKNIDNVMRFLGDFKFRNFSIVVRENAVAYGSWSWDWDVKSVFGSSNHSHVYFIDSRERDDPHQFDSSLCCYDILASSSSWDDGPSYAQFLYDLSPAFFLMKRQVPIDQGVLGYWSPESIDGWWHFDITRNITGHFKVYINGTLRIEAQDNTHMTSGSLWMNTETGTNIGFDNFVVTETAEIPTSTGSTSTSSSDDQTSSTSNISISTTNLSLTSSSDSNESNFLFNGYMLLPMLILIYQSRKMNRVSN